MSRGALETRSHQVDPALLPNCRQLSRKPQWCSQNCISDEKFGNSAYNDRNVQPMPEEPHNNSARERSPFACGAKGCCLAIGIGSIQHELGYEQAHRDDDNQRPKSNGQDVRGC